MSQEQLKINLGENKRLGAEGKGMGEERQATMARQGKPCLNENE